MVHVYSFSHGFYFYVKIDRIFLTTVLYKEHTYMKKIAVSLIVITIIGNIGATKNKPEVLAAAPWIVVIALDDGQALEELWESNNRQVPTNAGLAYCATVRNNNMLGKLIRLAAASTPSSVVSFLTEFRFEKDESSRITPLGWYVKHDQWQEVFTVLQRPEGVSPFALAYAYKNQDGEYVHLNLFEYAYSLGKSANLAEILSELKEPENRTAYYIPERMI